MIFASSPVLASDNLSEIDKIVIQSKCTDLLMNYGDALDREDLELLLSLFTEQGVWAAEEDLRFEGKDFIREFWSSRWSHQPGGTGGTRVDAGSRVVHHDVTSTRFSVVDDDMALGRGFVALYIYDAKDAKKNISLAPRMLVSYKLQCVRTDGGWRFQEMILSPAMDAAWTGVPNNDYWRERIRERSQGAPAP